MLNQNAEDLRQRLDIENKLALIAEELRMRDEIMERLLLLFDEYSAPLSLMQLIADYKIVKARNMADRLQAKENLRCP